MPTLHRFLSLMSSHPFAFSSSRMQHAPCARHPVVYTAVWSRYFVLQSMLCKRRCCGARDARCREGSERRRRRRCRLTPRNDRDGDSERRRRQVQHYCTPPHATNSVHWVGGQLIQRDTLYGTLIQWDTVRNIDTPGQSVWDINTMGHTVWDTDTMRHCGGQ